LGLQLCVFLLALFQHLRPPAIIEIFGTLTLSCFGFAFLLCSNGLVFEFLEEVPLLFVLWMGGCGGI